MRRLLACLGQGAQALAAAWAEASGAAPLRRRAAAIQAAHLAHGGAPLSEAEAMRQAMAAQHAGDRPRCC